jgi:hypothetical protein
MKFLLENEFLSYSSELREFFENFGLLFYLFSFLSPILLISGLLRFIGIEKPSLFARISRFLSKPIVGNFDKIVGLKMIRSKQLIKWIKIFAIFSTLFISVHILHSSLNKYQQVITNTKIGGDLKLTAYLPDYDPNIFSKLDETEHLISSLQNTQNESYVKSIISSYAIEMENDEDYRRHRLLGFSTNISKYVDIIQEDNKLLPNRDIIENLQKLEDYQASNPSIPGVLLSSSLENQVGYYLNKVIKFGFMMLNYSSGELEQTTISQKVIGYLEFPPGLVDPRGGYHYETRGNFVLLDELNFRNSSLIPNVLMINQLIDLDLKFAPEAAVINESISNISQDIINYSYFQYYGSEIAPEAIYDSGSLMLGQIFEIIELIMYILAFILSLALGLILIAVREGDKHFYSLMYTRGYGKKGNLRFLISQMWIIFLFGLILGLLGGFVMPSFILKFLKQGISYEISDIYNTNLSINLPFYWNPLKIFSLLGFIIIFSFSIFLITNAIKKQKITQNLQKF